VTATISGCDRQAPATPSKQDTAKAGSTGDNASAAKRDVLDDFVAQQARRPAMSTPPGAPAGELPPGHPPTGGLPPNHPPAGGEAAPAAAERMAPLKFTAPASWKLQPTRSQFRKAQYGIPRTEGDSEDGLMILYYFGKGEGGPVEQNLVRWQGMFTTADGQPVGEDAVKRSELEISGHKVTMLEVTGRYFDQMTVATRSDAEFAMLAAIVETSDGPWFFKAIGPSATMAANRDAFLEMIGTVRR
jgi:hypothetical protein